MRPRQSPAYFSKAGRHPLWSYLHTGTLLPLISFVCHSYENCRGGHRFFPFWNSTLATRVHESPVNMSFPSPPSSSFARHTSENFARNRASDHDASPERAARVEGSLLCVKPFVYHTCTKLPRNPFACHTSKIAGLKVLCLPHIQHPPEGCWSFVNRKFDEDSFGQSRAADTALPANGRVALRSTPRIEESATYGRSV